MTHKASTRRSVPIRLPGLPRAAARILPFLLLATQATAQQTFRLYQGITAYVHNPNGKAFAVNLDLRDLNLYANGPREVLFKVYDPDGVPVVREIIPDDGVTSESYLPRIGGWDHELNYYTLCYAQGSKPMLRWSAFSDPARLEKAVKRSFTRELPAGKPGTYRILLVGERDHYVTLNLEPGLAYGVCGHVTWLHGHHDLWQRSYMYVPRGSTGLHVALVEPDRPQERRLRIAAQDGAVLYDGAAGGGFATSTVKFDGQQYDDAVFTVEVSPGANDYLLRATLQRPGKAYGGWGSPALLCPDEAAARALRGGAIYADDDVYWHPWQLRYDRWLKAHTLKGTPELDAIDAQLRELQRYFRLIGPSDGRDPGSWVNWAYGMGYYDFKVWQPAWRLSRNTSVPSEIMDIIREACLMTGERLSFALGIERVNGNAFAQIPVHLWYCQAITGDAMVRQRYDTWFERWRTEGWGEGAGIGPSGDAQEHFAHDAGYGSYIVDNWSGTADHGGTWVPDGILSDTDDPRFREVFDRVMNLFSHIYCAGRVNAYPWNSRIHSGPVEAVKKHLTGRHAWKGEPGPDLTASVNDGNEWFAARRRNYYLVTFHGRLAPRWMNELFWGQLGFGGGAICQLTVPGRGTVLNSMVADSYGKGMHLSNWRNFHVHGIVGEMWDGQPLVAAVSEHLNARLEGNRVTGSSDVRDRDIGVERSYTYLPDAIECEARLRPPSYAPIVTMWSAGRPLAELREAYEMIPFTSGAVSALGDNGEPAGALTAEPVETAALLIDCGGYGARIELDRSRRVRLGANKTILIELAARGESFTPAADVAIRYRLAPFAHPPQ